MDLKLHITPKELKEILTKVVALDRPPTVFVWSSPGIGKSDIINQIGKEMNIPVTTTILSLMDPIETKGLLVYNKDVKKAEFVPLRDIPVGKSIWFLDETPTAPPSVLNTMLRAIQEKWLGNAKIPDECAIICAGNRNSDKVTPFKLSSAFINRPIHLSLVHSFSDWKEWAYKNKVKPEVVAYLEMFPDDFCKSPRIDAPYPTPRSWHGVSNIMDTNIDVLVNGYVGEDIGTRFQEFRKNSFGVKEMIEDILRGNNVYPTEKEPGKSYIISTVLSRGEEAQQIERSFDYINNCPNHWNVFGILMAKNIVMNIPLPKIMKIDQGIRKTFSKKYTDVGLFR